MDCGRVEGWNTEWVRHESGVFLNASQGREVR